MKKLALGLLALVQSATAQASDLQMLNRISDQALNHSEILETAAYLTDRIGARLTNSPAMRQAEQWTQQRFRDWGLKNVRAEGFEFGRGWWIESSSVRMIAPRPLMLRAIPLPWTPSTNGPISAEIIVAPMSEEKHFDKWKGKLKDKIVLISYPEPSKDETEVPFKRLTESDLASMDKAQELPYRQGYLLRLQTFANQLDDFLHSEGALAWGRISRRPHGLLVANSYQFRVGETPFLPAIELSVEDYGRLVRLSKTGSVTLSIDNDVHFDDRDTKAYNILADIPGHDLKAGHVMAGAHLDSWIAGDGAIDNAAGTTVVMEAARILNALGVKPKRTIRFALWNGEEQDQSGSTAYLDKHVARRLIPEDAKEKKFSASHTGMGFPIYPLSGYSEISGYFNIDTGSGRIRSIYTGTNFAAKALLKEWMAPLAAFGVSSPISSSLPYTDHEFFERAGLAAFTFVQDPLDYWSIAHHSSADTFERIRPDDLRQAAIVLAYLLWKAAESEKPLPGIVIPTEPRPSFDYSVSSD